MNVRSFHIHNYLQGVILSCIYDRTYQCISENQYFEEIGMSKDSIIQYVKDGVSSNCTKQFVYYCSQSTVILSK